MVWQRKLALYAAILFPAFALIAFGASAYFAKPKITEATASDADRTSYAVGLSAGAGFRGVVPVTMDAFRQGLIDGLGGDATQTRVMPRPELFARMRELMKELSDAELAEVSKRIDSMQDS